MKQDPVAKFRNWYRSAKRREKLAEACALATADASGKPAVRFVLLKGADERGFVFYSHSDSMKGRDLAANPRAALAFYWDRAGRQVRVQGPVQEVSRAEADAYWASRPRLSQIGAWASHQSRPLRHRAELLARAAAAAIKYRGMPVPRPRTWTGFRILPKQVEFWTRKSFRMHHRELYIKAGKGWNRVLLQP